jgi:hypothetical protein
MITILPNSLVLLDKDIQLNCEEEIHSTSSLLCHFSSSGFLDFFDREKFLLEIMKIRFMNGKSLYLRFSEEDIDYVHSMIKWVDKRNFPIFFITNRKNSFFPKYVKNMKPELISNVSRSLEEIIRKKKGITVVGDIHGNFSALMSSVNWALSRGNFIVFLGDLIDHGDSNLSVVLSVYNLVLSNNALLILGNHERKFLKYMNSFFHRGNVHVSENNRKTIDEFSNLKFVRKEEFYIKYKCLISKSRTHFYFDNLIFVHGGWSREFDNYENCSYLPKPLEDLALIGEKETSGWKTTFSWKEDIPKNKIVFVGHDTISALKPSIMTNSQGGKLVKMDLGCGNGGFLASCDLSRNEKGEWNIVNFNIHN